MANPRKFSEKIALHNQKQAEETAAFEAILKEVQTTTKAAASPVIPVQQKHLQLQPNLGAYRGGSLPNVNSGIDLQAALHSLEGMKQSAGRQSLVDRIHRDRGRPVATHNRRSAPFDKRVDTSPYQSPFLSPPDNSWRRTSSDSALHTSAMAPQLQVLPGGPIPPTHRRMDTVPQQPIDAGGGIPLINDHLWDPKKQQVDVAQRRPSSCEVPGINIYPSPEQDSGVHIPITNNTGSLPDLSNLHFPSGLPTPVDDDPGYSQHQQGGALEINVSGLTDSNKYHPYHSPNHHHHHHPHSNQGNTTDQQHQQLVTGLMQYLQVPNQRSPVPQHLTNGKQPPAATPIDIQTSPQGGLLTVATPPRITTPTGVDSLGSSPVQQQGDLMSHYRSSTSDCPQSPTSPLSQHSSYSPSQSPGLANNSLGNSATFPDTYYLQDLHALDQQQQQQQQAAQTSALQHQFEQFNMQQQMQDAAAAVAASMGGGVVANSANNNMAAMYSGGTTTFNNIQFTQAINSIALGAGGSRDHSPVGNTVVSNHGNHYYSSSPQQPSSPQTPRSPQGPPSPTVHSQGSPQQIPPSPTSHQHCQDLTFGFPASMINALTSQANTQGSNMIPDIILTGVDDHLSRQDLVKDISSAMAGMVDPFDSELFSTDDDVLKDSLEPLDLDGLQMLTDPNMITDPATEDSFRLGL